MVRKNEDRFGPKATAADEIPADVKQAMNPMDFVTPTDFVELPSEGKFYPSGHPLHEEETIEIRLMTAKDEDILTSRALLKKGIALERLIDNLIVNKRITAKDLLIGDRNAIIIKARGAAYGYEYKTSITCPGCSERSTRKFNLGKPQVYNGDEWGDFKLEKTERGTYKVELPMSKVVAEIRHLVGADEVNLIGSLTSKKKKDKVDQLITGQMKSFIVSVNSYEEPNVIEYFIQNMVAHEARFLRNVMKAITPDLKVVDDFECDSCGFQQELEVPFGADFFWPDR